MSFDLILTALELGIISSVTVLALFLSYEMLNVCDLSTDGCYILGAAVGTAVAVAGHPYLSVFAAMAAGVASGFVTSFLQTKMGIDSLLSGIIVNTGLYSVNMFVLGKSTVNMFKVETVFTKVKALLKGSVFEKYYALIIAAAIALIVAALLSLFLKTRLGLAIRATGDNPDIVRSSSINPAVTVMIGLCASNSLTALSGCLFAQYNKSIDIKDGTGIVTIALASLLIGKAFLGKKKIFAKALGAILGSVIFRLVYTFALRLNMPSYMLKLVSSVIVIIAISAPYIGKKMPYFRRRYAHAKERSTRNA